MKHPDQHISKQKSKKKANYKTNKNVYVNFHKLKEFKKYLMKLSAVSAKILKTLNPCQRFYSTRIL